jgi:ABC-2 type transport system ATP-binding protein
VQVDTAGAADVAAVRQRLEQVPGVNRVVDRAASDHRFVFEIENLAGQNVRGDLARAVVNAGWNLLELKSMTLSLEEVFLELTGVHPAHAEPAATPPAETTPAGGNA